MESADFYTFDEITSGQTTSGESIEQGKLKRLVSEGEISAFRDGDVMKFKKTEIDAWLERGNPPRGETVLSEITLEDEPPCFEEEGEVLTDDLVFESSGEDRDFEVSEAIHAAGNPPHEEDVSPTSLTISIVMNSGIATFTPNPKTGEDSMELDFGRRFTQKAAHAFIQAMGAALGSAPKVETAGSGRATEITAVFDS